MHYTTIAELSKDIESQNVSPVEIAKTMLDRIEAVDPALKSYATVTPELALQQAEAAEKEIAGGTYRGPLHGVPIAVKDLCYTEGIRTMGGLGVLKDHVPDFDATVVQRLREAGAVLLGKLNLTEGAMAGYNPDFDAPVNPWNAERWSGVSSSGSGVATAAGLCFASLGTDTGGSIRTPSAANGVTGIKPTWGRVSRYGVLDLGESLDHVGPMTRSAMDAAIVLEAIAGHDPKDPTSIHDPAFGVLDTIEDGVQGLRIGIDEAYLTQSVDPEVHAAVAAAIDVLKDQGAKLVEIQLPNFDEVLGHWLVLCSAEALAAHADYFPSRADEYGPWFRDFLGIGAGVSGADYARAHFARLALCGEMRVVMEDIDLIACPSMPVPAFPVTREELFGPMAPPEPDSPMNTMMRYTAPYDFTGQPTISMPCGFSGDGLPLSLQLVGRLNEEATVCRAGHAYQQATDWHTKHPEV